jgi:hypothetical protein
MAGYLSAACPPTRAHEGFLTDDYPTCRQDHLGDRVGSWQQCPAKSRAEPQAICFSSREESLLDRRPTSLYRNIAKHLLLKRKSGNPPFAPLNELVDGLHHARPRQCDRREYNH